MQREIMDLATALYQACGGRLYRLLPETLASQVKLSDGVDVQTRLLALERGLAANTTTHICDNIGQRDGILNKISGDRCFVSDASGDAAIGEGPAMYIWLAPDGWKLLWSGQTDVNLAAAVGAGLYMDKGGRLSVEWTAMPGDVWQGYLPDALGKVLGTGLKAVNGVWSVDWTAMPLAAVRTLVKAGDGLEWQADGLALKLKHAHIQGALTLGHGLAWAETGFKVQGLVLDDLTDLDGLAQRLTGAGLIASNGKLGLHAAGLSAGQKRQFLSAFTGDGLAINAEGCLEADFSQVPEDIIRRGVPAGDGLVWRDGALCVTMSDSVNNGTAGMVATSSAVRTVYDLASDAAFNAGQSLSNAAEAMSAAMEAEEIATGAVTAAGEARTAAGQAQATAERAQASADSAQAAANDASSKADTAQATADSAANKANTAQSTANQALAGLPLAASATPQAHGAASAGSSAKYAREDHVHPSNNTDTHWTTHLYVGAANGAVNAATANGGTCLIVLDNSTVRDRRLIKGAGSVAVSSDANGDITITGTDTNTTYGAATQTANGLMSAADKKKLDGIAAGAQANPTLASLGGVAKAGDSMSGMLVIDTSTGGALRFYDPYKTLGGNASGSTRWKTLDFCDKSGNIMAQLAHGVDTNGWSFLNLSLDQNTTASSRENCRVLLSASKDGTYRQASVPIPADTDNSSSAATTGWTRARISAATGKGATTFSLNSAEIMTLTLEDGSQAEACAWSEDMVTPLMLESALAALKDMISSTIFAGFHYEIDGVEYYFTYDLYDQQNLADAAILGLRNRPAYVFARDDSATMRALELPPQKAMDLHEHATIVHKRGLMNLGLELSRDIHGCVNSTQLESLLREAGLFESYRDYLRTKSVEEPAELNMDSIMRRDETENRQIIIVEA